MPLVSCDWIRRSRNSVRAMSYEWFRASENGNNVSWSGPEILVSTCSIAQARDLTRIGRSTRGFAPRPHTTAVKIDRQANRPQRLIFEAQEPFLNCETRGGRQEN